MDSNGNALLAGYSTDWGLTGANTRLRLPIMVIMDKSGAYLVYMRYHYTDSNEFNSAKFKPNDETKVIAITGSVGYNFYIFVLSAADGSIIGRYKLKSS